MLGAVGDGSSDWVSVTHMGDLGGALVRLACGSALAQRWLDIAPFIQKASRSTH